MLASQTVFVTLDRKRAVKEGEPAAQFLLVRAGGEISAEEAAKYKGATELIGGTKPATAVDTRKVQTKEPAPTNRDPAPATKAPARRG